MSHESEWAGFDALGDDPLLLTFDFLDTDALERVRRGCARFKATVESAAMLHLLQQRLDAIPGSRGVDASRKRDLDGVLESLRVLEMLAERGPSPLLRSLDHPHGGAGVSALGTYQDKLLTGSDNGEIKVWSTLTFLCEATLPGHVATAVTAFAEHNAHVYSAQRDGQISVWNAEWDWALVHMLRGSVSAPCWALILMRLPSGHEVLASVSGPNVLVWDLDGGWRVERTLTGHAESVWALTSCRGGAKLVSGSADCTMRVWDTATWACERTLAERSSVWALSTLDDGQLVSGARYIRLWDTATWTSERALTEHGDTVASLAVLERGRGEGDRLSGTRDRTVQVWGKDEGEGAKKKRFGLVPPPPWMCRHTLDEAHAQGSSALLRISGDRVVTVSPDSAMLVFVA